MNEISALTKETSESSHPLHHLRLQKKKMAVYNLEETSHQNLTILTL